MGGLHVLDFPNTISQAALNEAIDTLGFKSNRVMRLVITPKGVEATIAIEDLLGTVVGEATVYVYCVPGKG